METDGITTPFGRRAMTLGMLASQAIAKTVSPEASVDKWKLYRWLCEARPKLGISDRALSVLNALMSFYPKTELCGNEGLVVFPSNAQLSLRTHGMAETTLRRHLAALVEVGLLTRRDSPNGKRYVRRDRQGEIGEAYGFSLAPLLARAGEIETVAAEVTAERLLLQRMRERITLVRRDIAKLIETALEDGLQGEWMRYEAEYRLQVLALPRVATPEILAPILAALEALREEILKCMKQQLILRNTAGNADILSGTNRIQNPTPLLTLNLASNRSRVAMAISDMKRWRVGRRQHVQAEPQMTQRAVQYRATGIAAASPGRQRPASRISPTRSVSSCRPARKLSPSVLEVRSRVGAT